jgi:translocation and assembly module TamB
MATDPPPPPEIVEEAPTVHVVERTPVWQRVVKWGAITIGTLALLAGLLVIGINTQPGRNLVTQQINKLVLASGLNFRIGRIDGSLYGALVLRDVEVRDTQGTFATAKEIALDWRPFKYLRNHVDIRSLTSPEVRLLRMPALKPSTDPSGPLLPDIDIDIARLDVARIDIAPAIDGQRHIGRLKGSAHIAGGRAQIVLDGGDHRGARGCRRRCARSSSTRCPSRTSSTST